MTVDGIDFFVTSEYGEELYNSCKDVKFGTMNTRSMDFIGGAAQNYKGERVPVIFPVSEWSCDEG